MTTNTVSIKDFINSSSPLGVGYKDYWKDSNIDKNVFLPHEQLMTIERRIIWAAMKIGMNNISEEHKTPELAGEVLKYHIAGDASVQDSIKGLAKDYKRQPACRILRGVGNMGIHPGDPGAAARYTFVQGTPLLQAIIRDIKHVPIVSDETGIDQPEYVSTPIPMILINGISNIGTGHSAYYDERDAREVVDWIEDLVEGRDTEIPDPTSSTGCKVWKNPSNGYTYYEAVVHREGQYDIITHLPPKSSSTIVLAKLEAKLGNKSKYVENASEDGRPVWIKVKKGILKPEDYTKYSMRTARIEKPYIWDTELDTMRMSSHEEVAMAWFNNRMEIIKKRIKSDIASIDKAVHIIDCVLRFENENMKDYPEEKIQDIFGAEDAKIILDMPRRAFLKANIEKSIKRKEKLLAERAELESKDIKETLFFEARDIIEKQEAYFKKFEE